ncbi:MAG: acyl carrier protein [Clostridia bacterium]|nr:acyl carrier protein [Clostridia bacterium]MBQ7087547.1 acyl carrier protein [Clostridia bacterium]MBQ7094341.1 acyl carrier protein [Clostridia bacterium]
MVFEKLRALIVETLEIDEDKITMDATFDDLMLDSLDLVELVMAAEDEFDIHVEDDALDGLETIGDVVDLLTDLIG